MVVTDSCLAVSMKLQVLMTMISASSALEVSWAPLWWSMPIMTSESTRFLGQPSETKPTLGLASEDVTGASRTPVFSVVIGGATDLYFSIFIEFSLGFQARMLCRSGDRKRKQAKLLSLTFW